MNKLPQIMTTNASASQQAYEYIRQKLHGREVTPGMRLTFRQLAKELGMSRIPISEAVRRLEQDGLVVCTPRGVYVNSLTIREVEEIFDIREVMEGLSCRLFTSIATVADLEVLRNHSEQFDKHVAKGRLDLAQEPNTAFHSHIVKRCPYPYLSQLLDNIFVRVQVMSITSLWAKKESWHVDRWKHGTLIDAIERRDLSEAETIMREHIRWSKEDIISAMVKAGHR